MPLAVPFIAGPSSIALLQLVALKQPHALGWSALATVAAWLPAAVILWLSPVVLRWLGKKGSRAMKRLMGLLLIMVAVQMFLDGLAEYQSK